MGLNLGLGLNHWSFSWLEHSVKFMSYTILNSKFTYSNHLNSSHLNFITLRHGWDWQNIWTWLRTRVFRSVFNAVYTLLVLKCYIKNIFLFFHTAADYWFHALIWCPVVSHPGWWININCMIRSNMSKWPPWMKDNDFAKRNWFLYGTLNLTWNVSMRVLCI